MQLTKLFKEFFESEKAGGIILMLCTMLSLLLVNSSFSEAYLHIWHWPLFGENIEHWINDGLMAIFFLLIGLELEREVYNGELSNLKNALLPMMAALGGMILPVVIYFGFNIQKANLSGAGIPMATDIAFALGILSLLGNRIPASLKVFLTALAVIDDLGAILVIAIFYTGTIIWSNLLISLGIFGFLLILNRLKVYSLIPYLIGGVFMWYFMLHSGIHATITGVLLAFAIPFGKGDESSISIKLQHFLHKPVAYLILPLFALANTAILLNADFSEVLTQANSLGIALGLIIGKPIGVVLFSYAAVLIGWCNLPDDVNWKQILGAGILGGIGFTMSIFITLLSFDNNEIIINSKLLILLASLIAGIIGYLYLRIVSPRPSQTN
ncbi:MAG: Na+/H+ antiporter NhaA [Bacteroidetes bacterium]|nr:Na+/H+ antiporter NhaA [Bacteroidota bacterium]